MTTTDTTPAAIAEPAFTFDAPYEAYVKKGLYGEYVALHRAGKLIASFSFNEWGGEQAAIQAAWNFAYGKETCAECDALAAERDRLAAENERLRMMLREFVDAYDEGTGMTSLVYETHAAIDWRDTSTKTEDGYNG